MVAAGERPRSSPVHSDSILVTVRGFFDAGSACLTKQDGENDKDHGGVLTLFDVRVAETADIDRRSAGARSGAARVGAAPRYSRLISIVFAPFGTSVSVVLPPGQRTRIADGLPASTVVAESTDQ